MKKTISFLFSLILFISLCPVSFYSYNVEIFNTKTNAQSNKDAILNNATFSNTISYTEYPVNIRATYSKQTGMTTCRVTFNSSFKGNRAFVQIYSVGNDDNNILFSDYVSIDDDIVFSTSKTEHVISIGCNDYVYIGALLLYESGIQAVLYDINFSKFKILDFNPNLAIYNRLPPDCIDCLKTVSVVHSDNILSDGKQQIIYEESTSDSCTYYFKIDNGGLANLQFQSFDPNATYEIAVYFHASHYDKKAEDTLIIKYTVTGNSRILPVLLPAGYKYITITRLYDSKESNTENMNSAYGIIINQRKWENCSETLSQRNYTQGDALPCVGTPPSYIASNLFYSKIFFNCPSCNSTHNIKTETNCYNYALNIAHNFSMNLYSNIYKSALDSYCGIGYEIGEMSGYTGPLSNETELRTKMEEDVSFEQSLNDEFYNDNNTTGYLQAVNSTSVSPCPTYRYKIAYCYFVDSNNHLYYHFYRQNPIELGGTFAKWSHKEGFGASVTTEDEDGDDIYNPYWCDRGAYVTFGRYYVVRNPAVSS